MTNGSDPIPNEVARACARVIVGARGIVQPEQRDVGRISWRIVEGLAHLLLADVDARGARERERDVVGRERDPATRRSPKPSSRSAVARAQAPLPRQPALDHDLAGRGPTGRARR